MVLSHGYKGAANLIGIFSLKFAAMFCKTSDLDELQHIMYGSTEHQVVMNLNIKSS